MNGRSSSFKWLGLGLLVGVSLLLVSCSGPALRRQFRSYNEAYGDALNHEMLLNLARLENGHPAYYLAIGAINNKLIFSSATAAGTAGSFQNTDTTTHNTPFVSGTPTSIAGFPLRALSAVMQTLFGYSVSETIVASSNPEFQFIPINNETAARQVLQPISTDVFLALYQQGHPIDQLLRVMIERIETPRLQSGEQLVLMNSPRSGTAESYERFLRACAILRELQKHGYLSLEARSEKDLVGTVSFDKTGGHNFTNLDKNLWPEHNESGETNRLVNGAIQFLKTNETSIGKKPFSLEEYQAAATNVVFALNDGIVIQAGSGATDARTSRLVLRSFNRAMEMVASEQVAFEALVEKDTANFARIVPALERRPILQMLWAGHHAKWLAPPVQTLGYAGKNYQISDSLENPLYPGERWNRDVFRMMVALSSQVTVDIAKFQRQVLELSP